MSHPSSHSGSCDDGRRCGRGFLHGRGCSWSSSVVLESEFCARGPHRVYRFLELSLTLLSLPEAGIEYRLQGRYFLEISQRQRRAFIDSSGDLGQSRSYSWFILSGGLTGRKAQWVLPFLFLFSCRCWSQRGRYDFQSPSPRVWKDQFTPGKFCGQAWGYIPVLIREQPQGRNLYLTEIINYA